MNRIFAKVPVSDVTPKKNLTEVEKKTAITVPYNYYDKEYCHIVQ
ncbi:hypothetical protein [Pseudobacillus badius]|nr:hypothetical protein [Bacillus badius]